MMMSPEDKIIVTTGRSPESSQEELAREMASFLGCAYVLREKKTRNQVMQENDADVAVVVGGDDTRVYFEGQTYAYHPNMATHRVRNMEEGKKDRLVKVAGIKEGDHVLDATCGLGADAVVLSDAVGARGKVTALESSRVLTGLVKFGLQNYEKGSAVLREAMRRVSVEPKRYQEVFRELTENSYDIVYFDPMFEQTKKSSVGLSLVRSFASYEKPTKEDFEEARRVAKRAVVVKDRAPGSFLEFMDIPIVSRAKNIYYGKIMK